MMMKGSHFKETFSLGDLEVQDLQYIADRFADGDDGDDREEDPMPGHQGYHSKHSPQRERTCIPHDHHGRVHVEPQKTKQRPNDSEAEAGDEGVSIH